MKTISVVVGLFVLSVVGLFALAADPVSIQAGAAVSAGGNTGGAVGAFYDALLPYGNWVYTDSCGWVWYPYNVPVDWRPYTHGQWVQTDAGWTFNSDDPWGWAVYHYGRWSFDDTYGWVWCPGAEWAPSWVAWRRGDDYIGWAPIPPSIPWQEDTGFAAAGVDWDTAFPAYSWSFVPYDNFLASDVDDYLILTAQNVGLFPYTTFDFGFSFDRDHGLFTNFFRDEDAFDRRFEERTGRHIDRLGLASVGQPGPGRIEGRNLQVFRPDVRTQEGRLAARQLPVGAVTKPAELASRQEDQRRVLERNINTYRGMLDEAHSSELQHPPQGVTQEQLQARHQAEVNAFNAHADTQRRLLQNAHQFEERMYTAPAAPPRQRFDFAPPRSVERPAPSRQVFPQPVFQRGAPSGGSGERARGSEGGGGRRR